MKITITELRKNTSKYLALAESEVIFITKRGKIVAQLSKPQLSQKLDALDELTGIAYNGKNLSLEEIKNGRLERQ